LRGLAGTLFPLASRIYAFDAWPRHWSIDLKMEQNRILSFPVKKVPHCQLRLVRHLFACHLIKFFFDFLDR
ncbi:hypothetical protein, partial [Sporolactobacillus inulinus]|uniref:hypothetical protein n=1 Tax=Sporolactobacillus inulinus TaxID=2078 RepID=UPI001C3F59F3